MERSVVLPEQEIAQVKVMDTVPAVMTATRAKELRLGSYNCQFPHAKSSGWCIIISGVGILGGRFVELFVFFYGCKAELEIFWPLAAFAAPRCGNGLVRAADALKGGRSGQL